MPDELPKTYRPADHEERIRARWDDARAFHADPARVHDGSKRPYCVLIPPPNVTAALHLGHALNNSLQDVLVRAHRMMGHEALWLPGTDHAGIATQTVVDKRLQAEGKPALADYKKLEAEGQNGREQFTKLVQDWKDEYEHRITDQLKAMGCSCDWDRQRFTMDPVCARAVREGFFRLFKDGLIERGKRLVNWDPVTLTALADDEVESRDVDGFFYYLRYPLVHAPDNPDDRQDTQPVTWSELLARGYPAEHTPEGVGDDEPAWITVATTRPETYLGDTGVAINPRDPRAKPIKGLRVQLPLVGRVIPIVEDDYVVMPDFITGEDSGDPKAKMATGFLKVTPAHDPNDWQIGLRHDLRVINVMAPDASISPDHGWDDYDPRSGAHVFVGKAREEARKLVVKEFEARTVGPGSTHHLFEAKKPHRHAVGHSYRSHVPVEPYLSDQWYVRVTDARLVGAAQRALVPEQRTSDKHQANPANEQDASLRFYPDRYAKTYESWHDNLRDWCISRQLWWGHRIPVWHSTGYLMESQDQDRLTEATERLRGWAQAGRIAAQYRGEVSGLTRADLDHLESSNAFFVCVRDPEGEDREIVEFLESIRYRRDPDVLDTWFSSALWPLSTMGWPLDDLPAVAPEQIDPLAHVNIGSVWVKRVGTFHDFIGQEGAHSGELIAKLLHLRDLASTADGRQPLAYQLFREEDLLRDGALAVPLSNPDDISAATDLICAVGVKARAPVESPKLGGIHIPDLLLEHGFQDTAGLLRAFNPTNVLCTAREIITLWVSRMVMFNRYFKNHGRGEGDLPFADVFIHAMIQDGEGRKMSKSLGNGVDPLDIIHSHGADAMRFTLCQMTTQTQDVRMPVEADPETGRNTSPKFDLGRNFCNKIWNATRFTLSMLEGSDASEDPVERAGLSLPDRWMLARLASAQNAIEHALREYQFSSLAEALYDVFWRDFCDWYLEAVKPTVKDNPSQRATLRAVLDALVRLLHPVAPFVTETVFEVLRGVPARPVEGVTLGEPERDGLLCLAPWPELNTEDADAEAAFERVRTLVTAVREVRAKHRVPPKRRITLHAPHDLLDAMREGIPLVQTLAGVGTVTADEPAEHSVAFTHDSFELKLSDLADSLDEGAERDRLTKLVADLDKSIAVLEKRLANPGYAQKAPAHMVEQTRGELESKRGELDAARAALSDLA